jgi:tyrosine-protein phosphatase SIW14
MDAQKARIRVLAACVAAVSITVPAIAQTSTPAASVSSASSASSALSRIRIGNFGKINANYFRGSQPKGSDYKDLATLGVKTVIDLQKDGPSNEGSLVTAAGMKFVRIGMTTSQAPTDAQIAQFFEIVNNPANQPVYVHCAGGRHRTGTMTALYRMTFDGWNAGQAYSEMKEYRFEGFPDHPVLRNYVYAYKPALPKQPAVLATSIVTTK